MPKIEVHCESWHTATHSTPDDPYGIEYSEKFHRDHPGDVTPADAQVADLRKISIGWEKSPTGLVEIATIDPVAQSWLFSEIEAVLDKAPEHSGLVQASAVREALSRTRSMMPAYGFFSTFDRDGCNAIIRAVRKARDDAFGKDQ